jgi:sugar phosphate isomerase/epimerase
MSSSIGAQLYIFRDKFDLDHDLTRILDSLARDGYRAVEGSPGHRTRFKAELEQRGMHYAAPHVVLADLEDWSKTIEYSQAMGSDDICSSGLLQWNERRAPDYLNSARALNECGKHLRDVGIHLHYHNHDFEFEAVGGSTSGMDILLNELDFNIVDLCLDVGWVWRAGLDPAVWMQQHRDQIGYLHLRDFAGEESVALGQGSMDLEPIVATMNSLPNVRWIVIEQDPTAPDPLKSMSDSRAYLRDKFAV